MLAHRLRRWPAIKPTVVSVRKYWFIYVSPREVGGNRVRGGRTQSRLFQPNKWPWPVANAADTRHWTNAGLLLGRRRRRRANIQPALVQRFVSAANRRSWEGSSALTPFFLLRCVRGAHTIVCLQMAPDFGELLLHGFDQKVPRVCNNISLSTKQNPNRVINLKPHCDIGLLVCVSKTINAVSPLGLRKCWLTQKERCYTWEKYFFSIML